LESKEEVEKIFGEINKLPEKQKTALILKSIEGMPQKEIATVMKMKEKAVESLLSRARKNLKEKL
jgi:RNA polymerase sigma-70 factor (ECF subfamily)